MNSIYITLFAIVVTMLLTIFFPRVREAGPTARRRLWLVMTAGIAALAVAAMLATR